MNEFTLTGRVTKIEKLPNWFEVTINCHRYISTFENAESEDDFVIKTASTNKDVVECNIGDIFYAKGVLASENNRVILVARKAFAIKQIV